MRPLVTTILLCCLLLSACTTYNRAKEKTDAYPPIFPDYISVSIPCNIAPLNFMVEKASSIHANFSVDGVLLFSLNGEKNIRIPSRQWKKTLTQFAGKELNVSVSIWNNEHRDGIQYQTFPIHIATDSIDPWIAYRLIEPGYESWHTMEIRQREISSFDEKVIVSSNMTVKGCINCHSFCNYSSRDYMFHARTENGGTILVKNNIPHKIQLSKIEPNKEGAYPSWHPSGKYIAFSSNQTKQSFHSEDKKLIEVYDLASDLIIYDVARNKVITDPRFTEKSHFETFPSWSPDGKKLYFCRAEARQLPKELEKLRYQIYSVDFNEENGEFGNQVDTLLSPFSDKSASFPRISPDGNYLLYTEADYATFPIWHKEADLQMIRLNNSETINTDIINSNETESYHSWSSNGRWVIFSSRRADGLYTRLYITWFDKEGHLHKPFLLPQRNPDSNTLRLKSYNIPEFISEEVTTTTQEIDHVASY